MASGQGGGAYEYKSRRLRYLNEQSRFVPEPPDGDGGRADALGAVGPEFAALGSQPAIGYQQAEGEVRRVKCSTRECRATRQGVGSTQARRRGTSERSGGRPRSARRTVSTRQRAPAGAGGTTTVWFLLPRPR